jgi:hypothetical protein
MDKESRKKYFNKLKEKTPYSHKDIYYRGKKRKLPVYEIDLDYLVYNQWNGRIASVVKSHFKETGKEIEASTSEGRKLIEDFLWNSNITANTATEISIYDQGQNEYGIVTRDGVIIDGNRRTMILRRVAKSKKESPIFFLGVILDEFLDDDPKEIMRLETTYQMGEDAKVDYKPIEKYLKCQDLTNLGFSAEEIGKMMGETKTQIEENLEIMTLMDEYLEGLGYNEIYTRLNNTEDLFINLNNVLRKWSKSQGKLKWKTKESDLADFQLVCFDLIRYSYNSPKGKGIAPKAIREKLIRNSEDTFIANEGIWKDFSESHANNIEPISNNEKAVDKLREENPTTKVSQLFKSRDEAWTKAVDSNMKENFGLASSNLDNLLNKNEPLKLLSAALSKIETVESVSNTKPFLEDSKVFEIVDIIRKKSDTLKKMIITYQKSC